MFDVDYFLKLYLDAEEEVQESVYELLKASKTESLTPDKVKEIITRCGVHGVPQDMIDGLASAFSKEHATA